MSWNAQRMHELGARHADLEARGDLEGVMATLVPDPVYEFHPSGLCMRGSAQVRRYYTHLFAHFIPMTASYRLVEEWASTSSLAQEYQIDVRVDGAVESHRVLGILFAAGELLGGERVYGSDRIIRLMTGDLFEELTPLP